MERKQNNNSKRLLVRKQRKSPQPKDQLPAPVPVAAPVLNRTTTSTLVSSTVNANDTLTEAFSQVK